MLKVRPFQETLNAGMCGPASLKIVLKYFGVEASEQELAELSGASLKLGTDDKGIARAGKHFGFRVKIKNKSTFRDIEKYLDADIPVIVDWFSRGRSDYPDSCAADGHYSVACGIDDEHIYLQDPEIGKVRKMKKEDFAAVWFDFAGRRIEPGELIIRQLIAIYK